MSENFTVESTLGREEWTGRYGDMVTYRLAVNGGQEVDLNQKPETAAPAIGDEIWGHLEDGKYRPKLKKDQKQDASSSGGGKDDLGPVIHRQVALKILSERICTEGLTPGVKHLAEQIEQFIGEAGAANPGMGQNGAAAPNEAGRMTDAADLHGLLEKAGLDSSEASHVVAYALQEMTPTDQDQAIEKLRDESSRQFTADWLKSKTEAALGNPIPTGAGSGDDDIPF